MPLDINTGRPATLAPHGMVTSSHSLASAAGGDAFWLIHDGESSGISYLGGGGI